MKEIIKKIAGLIFRDYSAYYVYSWTAGDSFGFTDASTYRVERVDEAQIKACPEPLIRAQIDDAGNGAHAFACYRNDEIVSLCCYWYGERYVQKRNFIPIGDGEAKLVQIVTLPGERRKGIAAHLIAASSREMAKLGFNLLYARIWHSNRPSWHAFERAGWKRRELIIDVKPIGREKPFRVRFKARSKRAVQ